MGDFNCPEIDWASFHASTLPSTLLCDFVVDCCLQQFITEPTHVKGIILDLVLTSCGVNLNEVVIHSGPSPILVTSDHFPVSFSLSCLLQPHSVSSSFPSLNYSKVDYVGLNDYLLSLDWEQYFTSNDIEYLWATLKSVILESSSQFIPVSNPSRYPRWFSGPIKHKLHLVRSLRKKAKRVSFPCHREPFPSHREHMLHKAETDLQKDILEGKSRFESDLVDKFAFSNDSRIYTC